MQKKNKANLALGVSGAGFLATLAAGGTSFGEGLIHHGFLAATIGGLADWFAVTALFRHPLGISYRTDILRRNRARIEESIIAFASDDLLSVKNVMAVVASQDTAGLLVDYLAHRGGRQELIGVVEAVVCKVVDDLDSARVAANLAPAVREGLRSLALERVLAEFLLMLSEEQHAKRILHSVLMIGEQVLMSPAMQQVLLSHIEILRKEYEGESAGRAFVLSALGLDDTEILSIFNVKARAALHDMLGGKTEAYAGVKAGLETMLRTFAHDEELLSVLREWKEKCLDRADVEGMLAYWIEHGLKGDDPFWLPHLHRFVAVTIDRFCASKRWQRRVDLAIKKFAESLLEGHHDMIAGLIRERLKEFDDDALVHFVENKVQDDLQMIRINGALVGALVGMGLYLLVWVMERVWGQ